MSRTIAASVSAGPTSALAVSTQGYFLTGRIRGDFVQGPLEWRAPTP